MASQVNNYQCPACTGPLKFDPASGKLICEYCDSKFEIAEIEKLYAEQEAKAKAEYEQAVADGNGWDDSAMNGWGEDANGMKTYSCPSCGAELMCDETTAATSCPYCGNPTVVPGQFNETIKPDLIIPFKLDKEAAKQGLLNHYKGKKLLPKSFVSSNKVEDIKGIYVPFWLFDGQAEGQVKFEAEKEHTEREGNDEVVITEYYDVERSGHVKFEKVPVDASSKMPSSHMDSIEPFNYEELKEFSTAYLPGYLADKYDIDIETSAPRADIRFENSMVEELRGTVNDYSSVTMKEKNVKLTRGEVKYSLLPVWMLSTKWNDKTYTFAMNGQTGKMVGDLPIDKGKLVGYFALFFVIMAAIVAGVQLVFTENGIDPMWLILLPAIVSGVICFSFYGSMKSVAVATSAMHYVKEGSFVLKSQSDTCTGSEKKIISQEGQQGGGGPGPRI